MNSKNKTPKISIIIPIYNVDEYLEKCLNSIFEQSFNDIEVICVNDGSEDKSYNILKKYKKLYDNIILLDQENQGVSSARNAGIRISRGEYILFVDPDDVLKKDACGVAYLDAKKEDADILSFGYYKINYPYHRWYHKPFCTREHVYTIDPFLALFETHNNVLVWNKLYKRELLLKNNIFFDEDLRYLEDECFNFMIFPKAKKIKYIPNILYDYMVNRSGSAINSYSSKTKILPQRILINRICENWRKNKYLDEHGSQLLDFVLDFNYSSLYAILKDETKVENTIRDILFSLGDDIYNINNIKKLSTVCQNRVKELLK